MKKTVLFLISMTPALFGQETTLELDPAQSQVQFTLGATLHTVHGSFKLKRGSVNYDLATGKCTGEIVIDAQSGATGNDSRDNKMHKSVLESDRYPEMVFVPDHVEGTLAKASVHGRFRIHGNDHEMTMTFAAVPRGNEMEVTTQFVIPYIAWGMKNPSTLFLRVADKVDVEVRAHARILSGAPNATSAVQATAPGRRPAPDKAVPATIARSAVPAGS